MKQSELINLIGLKSTDPKLVDFFIQHGLGKPPKSVNANQNSKSIESKVLNLYFNFTYDIKNEKFLPFISTKNDDYNFVAYLSNVDFLVNGNTIKKPDPKPDDFWDVTPKPINSLAVFEKDFELRSDKSQTYFYYYQKLNENIEIIMNYSQTNERASSCFARIIE